MRFDFTIAINVERVEGKFASREEVEEMLLEAIEDIQNTQLDGLGVDGSSEYEITDFTVK